MTDSMRIFRQRRRGVSAVVAEVVMIAVLLVATVMLAGVTFGVFAIYYQPAEVAAEGATCIAAGNTTICQLTLTNQGSHDTATAGVCSLSGDAVASGSVEGGGTVPAGGSLSGVQCVVNGGSSFEGARISGAVLMTNGFYAYFVGTLE
jgi:hypothetical protein